MAIFLNIYIVAKSDVSKENIEAKMNLAIDWYRYSDTNYIVYTSSNVNKWQERLLEFVKPDGSLFICEIALANRNGWMTQAFWDWVKKDRTSKLKK
jgi:hypothetical protein